jgi:hypothetical protein
MPPSVRTNLTETRMFKGGVSLRVPAERESAIRRVLDSYRQPAIFSHRAGSKSSARLLLAPFHLAAVLENALCVPALTLTPGLSGQNTALCGPPHVKQASTTAGLAAGAAVD